jgi:membrane protein DedA with SNARE-associated domain
VPADLLNAATAFERFDRAEAYLRGRGASALVAVRFVAVIHTVVPIVAGVVKCRSAGRLTPAGGLPQRLQCE